MDWPWCFFCHIGCLSTPFHGLLWLYGKEQHKRSVKFLLLYSTKARNWVLKQYDRVYTFGLSIYSSTGIKCNISNRPGGSLMWSSFIVSGVRTYWTWVQWRNFPLNWEENRTEGVWVMPLLGNEKISLELRWIPQWIVTCGQRDWSGMCVGGYGGDIWDE